MAQTVALTPWMGCVTLTSSGTAYQLSALLAALAATAAAPPLLGNANQAQYLSLQVDIAAGAAKVYVGNKLVSSTNFGVALVATQAFPIYSMSSNLIRLDHIWLTSDTNSVNVGVSFITR